MALPSAALLAACLALMAMAACGGDEDEQFAEDFPPLSQRLVTLGREVGDAIETAGEASDQELADDFARFARQLGGLRRRLDALAPPEQLAAERDELVDAMGDVQTSLEGIADAAEQSNPEAARKATIDLIERSSELREARQTLVRAVREL